MEKKQYKVEYYTWIEDFNHYIANDWKVWRYGAMKLEEAINIALELMDLYIGPDTDHYNKWDNRDIGEVGAYKEDVWTGDADEIRIRFVPI